MMMMSTSSLIKTYFGLRRRSPQVQSSSPTTMATSTIIMFCVTIMMMIIEVEMINDFDPSVSSSSSSRPSFLNSVSLKIQQQRQALNCCQKAKNASRCKQECWKQIYSSNCPHWIKGPNCNQLKMVALDGLEQACGKPFMDPDQDNVWFCLINSGYFNTDHDPKLNDGHHNDDGDRGKSGQTSGGQYSYLGGMNPAKYSCCKRAISEELRKICYKTFSDHFDELSESIQESLVRFPGEKSFFRCLEDAENHCQYGCETRLEFCGQSQHFRNFRFPMRNCNHEADQKAMQMLEDMPRKLDIMSDLLHVKQRKNLDELKSIFCAINLKPCLPANHDPMPICSNNCDQLKEYVSGDNYLDEEKIGLIDKYSACGVAKYWLQLKSDVFGGRVPIQDADFVWFNDGDITVYQSPEIETYEHQDLCWNRTLMESKPPEESDENPLPSDDHGSFCSSSCFNNDRLHPKTCVKNRDCFVNDCPEFRCINQCPIGKLLETKIPQETMVRIPIVLDHSDAYKSTINLDKLNDENHCYHQCYCDSQGSLTDCYFHCLQSQDRLAVEWTESLLKRISCSFQCSKVLEPICAWKTGITYLNKCFHACFHDDDDGGDGHDSIIDGYCKRIGNNLKTICVQDRSNESSCVWDDNVQLFPLPANARIANQSLEQVCSSPLFQKEQLGGNWWKFDDTVCDTNGTHHPDPCSTMVQNDRVWPSHLGQCQVYCSMSGPVYGRDLKIYHSECAALAHGVLVDYFDLQDPICAQSGCPHDEYAHNLPLNHCQYCGSIEYFLYNPDYFKTITNKIDSDFLQYLLIDHRSSNMLTLVKQLRSLMSINVECELFAHLFTPGLVQVLIKPSKNVDGGGGVSVETLDACQKELQRLITLFVNRSPMIELQFPVGLLFYNQNVSRQLMLNNNNNNYDFEANKDESNKDDATSSESSSKSNPKPNLSYSTILASVVSVVVLKLLGMHRIH